jgi:predicted RNase H-like nuclease (RuvC/YqgF family)
VAKRVKHYQSENVVLRSNLQESNARIEALTESVESLIGMAKEIQQKLHTEQDIHRRTLQELERRILQEKCQKEEELYGSFWRRVLSLVC